MNELNFNDYKFKIIENINDENLTSDIEALKAEDRAEIERLQVEIRNASTESMLAEYNFATSLNDLILPLPY